MRVYIAGPMTGIEDWNYPLFFQVEEQLKELGYETVNPARSSGDTLEEALADAEVHPWSYFMKRDIPHVIQCDALCLLPGWRSSRGARLEVSIAKGLGIPLYVLGVSGLVPRVQAIGLSGYARSGKDTVGGVLSTHGYTRVSFADAMRTALERLNPYLANGLRLTDYVNQIGWEGAKVSAPEVREYLQKFGTEVGRHMFHEDFWVDLAIDMCPDGSKIVFTDVRFPNELAAVHALGGEVWRIEREGTGPVNGHASEIALDGARFDRVIRNCGSLRDLQEVVDAVATNLDGSIIRV